MDLSLESDNRRLCGLCPNSKVLFDSARVVAKRIETLDELQEELEKVADNVCGGCTRYEPVVEIDDDDISDDDDEGVLSVTIHTFPGRRAA